MANQTIWGMHAGSHGQADSLFEHGVVAIGWNEVGDLRLLPNNLGEYKQRVMQLYPEDKPGSWPLTAGMLFRFAHEMKPGDLVVNRSKVHKNFRIGRIVGEYLFQPNDVYAHQRKTEWIRTVEPSDITQGARYEVGSALSLFLVRNYADEWLDLLGGHKHPVPVPSVAEEDPTVGPVADEIETLARDFVHTNLSKHLKGHPFAHFVAHLLNILGYRTRVSPEGPDGGIDIVAHRDELGFEPPLIKVQVKSTTGSIGQPDVSALLGSLSTNEYGLLVTLGLFTSQAQNFAKSKSHLRLLDREDVVNLVLEHYESLDNRYKTIVPMRRVYVPQSADAD
jgi:restriction system protein